MKPEENQISYKPKPKKKNIKEWHALMIKDKILWLYLQKKETYYVFLAVLIIAFIIYYFDPKK